jgi:hypothetical protein
MDRFLGQIDWSLRQLPFAAKVAFTNAGANATIPPTGRQGEGMEREIKVAGVTFVVNDPHGSISRMEPRELKAEQAGLETAKTREQEAAPFGTLPKPNPSDPIGNIAARVSLFEAIAHGRTGPWGMFAAWTLSALFVYTFAWGAFHAPRAAIGITIGTLLLLGHTGFFLSATVSMLVRRAGK